MNEILPTYIFLTGIGFMILSFIILNLIYFFTRGDNELEEDIEGIGGLV